MSSELIVLLLALFVWGVVLVTGIISWYKTTDKDVVVFPDMLDAKEAIHILCKNLLGDDYYIVDPVSSKQANSIIVRDV